MTATDPEIQPLVVGARLRQARQDKSLTQERLSAITGIPKRTIENWEAGDHLPRGERLQLLSDELDVSVAWILTGVRALPDVLYQLLDRVEQNQQQITQLAEAFAQWVQLAEERSDQAADVLERLLALEQREAAEDAHAAPSKSRR